ncbi:MAG: protein kinase domain-containing protein [Chthoniobacterales bacterium]
MSPAPNQVICCAQCGAPIESEAADLGCLNCLLVGGFSEAGGETRRFQHYEVCLREDGVTLDQLGQGSMGITYRARDINLDSPVALKIISARYSGNPEARERFRHEARAAAQLRHPNVASVFHFGETEASQRFYAMELVEGETLEARVRRDGPLKTAVALEIVTQVAHALMAAEEHGLVHRDLKPSNIMVVATKPGGSDALVVKVIDFGLARAVTNTPVISTQAHAGFSGTPDFASPEQFKAGGAPLDVRSDIYSLGATLWYLLGGRTPFASRSPGKVKDQPLPLEQLAAAKVPVPMIGLLRSMLATNPTKRPQSARELLTALRRCREALEAKPRRRKLLKWAALALAFVTIGAVGLTNYFSHHSSTAMMAPEKSIAVLPFDSLSNDKEDSFFAVGVQDAILSNLARIADLKVISRTSVAQYKSGTARNLRDIGTTLGVAHLLEGSVQRVANRVRVNAQLIDARADAHLWAQTYDRDLADVFAIQSEIAQQIADQLRARLSPEEKVAIGERPTADLKAYAFYSEARAIFVYGDWQGVDKGSARKVGLLEEATQCDPKFALAYCLLAKTQADWYGLLGGDRTHLELARKAADTALRLRPDLGQSHVALARYYFYAGDLDRAHDELAVAARTMPNDADVLWMAGRNDRRQNRWNDSLAKLEKASELDPGNQEIRHYLWDTYREMRRYVAGRQFLEKAVASEPENVWVQMYLADLKLDTGDPAGAQSVLAKVPEDFPQARVWTARFNAALYLRDFDAANRVIAATPATFVDEAFGGQPPQSWADGLIARARGDKEKAQSGFGEARKRLDATQGSKLKDEDYFAQIARLDAGLGRKNESIAEARQAVELMPITRDSLAAPGLITNLALVYAWTGERDLAIEQLEIVAKIPAGPKYGDLHFNPCWDSLRGDPRFEKIVASLKPR